MLKSLDQPCSMSGCSLTTLNNLKPDCEGITNLIVVAYSISPTFSTKGNSHLCRIKLIDDSTPEIVTCILSDAQTSLPNVNGKPQPCIIRFTSVRVNYYAGHSQINKGRSYSFSFFDPNEENFEPLEVNRYYQGPLTDVEKARITELRAWLKSPSYQQAQFSSDMPRDIVGEKRTIAEDAAAQHTKRVQLIASQIGSTLDSEHVEEAADFDMIINERPVDRFNKFIDCPIPLEKVQLNMYCDVNMQVVGVGVSSKSVVVRCLDGTIPIVETLKISPLHIGSNLSQCALLQLDQYTVDVSVFDDHREMAMSLKCGDFVTFRNLHCYIPYGLSQPELVLHGGTVFNRGIRKLDGTITKWMENKIDEIPMDADDSAADNTFPDDEPRSIQTSPTKCLHPEQTLTTLTTILSKPKHKGLYKVRVFIHRHHPDSYANMLQTFCERCSVPKQTDQSTCPSCNESDFHKVLYCKLLIQDPSVPDPISVLCAGNQARQLVGVDKIKTSADVEMLGRMVGRWCDLHLLCKVQENQGAKLMLAHTIVKDNR